MAAISAAAAFDEYQVSFCGSHFVPLYAAAEPVTAGVRRAVTGAGVGAAGLVVQRLAGADRSCDSCQFFRPFAAVAFAVTGVMAAFLARFCVVPADLPVMHFAMVVALIC